MRFKKIKQRGQALVWYGLFAPLLFLILGVVMDLGWYYLNVSRLQNAADAAALAGAQTLVKNEDFKNYFVVSLASNELPADFADYGDVYKNTFDSTTIASGILYNYKKIDEIKDSLNAGREAAEEYAWKNLENGEEFTAASQQYDSFSVADDWSISSTDADKKVTGKIELKYKTVDGKNDVYGPLYYVVNLTEKIRHFFMPGWFDPMNAPVRAVVLLKPRYIGLIEPMQHLERTMVIDNWEYTNAYKDTTGFYSGKWNHYQAAPGLSGSSNKGIKYTSGNTYRTESVTVRTQDKNKDSTSSGTTTAANGNKFYSESEVDSINIDFRAEVTGKFKSDWDLGYDFPETGHKYQFAEGWSATDGADKRILFNADFDQSFRTRDPSKEADPLWVRIESDPLKNPYTGAGVSNFNSVRQITLNFNSDNSAVEGSGENQYYKYRPYVIFYTGPENIDYRTSNGVLIRHSQPVVINLNYDTNAIIYMPESPVVLNGNGHKLTGFIIAKCFLFSVTEEDMTNKGTVELYDGFNAPKNFTGDFSTGTDSQGQTVYFHDSDVLTYEELTALYDTDDATITTDPTTGNITVTDKIDAPRQPVISFTKDLYTNCTTLQEYLDITANYINTTYTKEKYMQFTGLSEDKVSMITFPDETYANGKYNNFTAITIPVATADLLDTDPDPSAAPKDDKYVKVMLGEEEKYIAKAKLPYTRIKRNANYPYVCIYDLKTGFNKKAETGFSGVKPTDDSIAASSDNSAVVFLNPAADNKEDSWAINKDLLEKTYDTNYQAAKLEIAEEGGVRYFMLKSEINDEPQVVGKYKKITTLDAQGKEVVKYLKNDNDLEYYTKVDNNKDADGNVKNYIITDKNGNMLTKTLTPPDVFNVKTQSTNETMKDDFVKTEDGSTVNSSPQGTYSSGSAALSAYWNVYTRDPKDPEEIPGDRGGTTEDGQYVGSSEYRKYEDYRIPALERVYRNTTFNLDSDSRYSYFQISDLKRINYTYLNVDEVNQISDYKDGDWDVKDMFFTTTRAEWID